MKNIEEKAKKILLWSQKYTKADMQYIVKNGSWVMLGQTVNGFLSLALIIAFANLLPKEVYGTYKYILSLVSILNIFTLTGMNSALSRTIARGGEGILRPVVLYQLKWNSLMTIAGFMLSGYYYFNGNEVFALSFFVLGFFTPLTLAFNTYGAYLEGKRKFNVVNILGILSTLIYSTGMYITLLLSDGVMWLVIMYALTTFVPSVIFYVYTVRTFKPPLTGNTEETFAYGWKLTLIRLLGPIASQIDKIILAHFWGPAELAVYSFAATIPNKAIPALKRLVDIGFPKFAAKTSIDINSVFYRRLFQGVLVGTIIMVSYILFVPYLFKYLLPQYIESIFYSQILAVSFIFALPSRYTSLLFESQKLSREVFINSLSQSIIAILLYLFLGILGGILGLVIAYVLISFIGLMINIYSWQKNSACYS